jgi:hypothetical protein
VKEGWNKARPEHIPPPTVWPAALALAVSFFAWGFVTSPIVLAMGLTLFTISLAGWIREIRHER